MNVREKAPSDPVSEADEASQSTIRQIIADAFPDHGFIGEEGVANHIPGRLNWIVDPLDGTVNFLHGMPQYAVSVAVADGSEILAGVVFDPTAEECFTAVRGEGALLNGSPIRTSEITDIGSALLAVSFPPHVQPDTPEIADFIRIVQDCQAIRRIGSAALNLCYIAAGRLEGYWAHTIYPWDVAAGVLMIRESGGVVTSLDGSPFDLWRPAFVAGGNPQMHQTLLSYMQTGES